MINPRSGADASNVDMKILGTPTYSTLQDWLNTTQSSGKISGGGFTDNTTGTVKVAAGTGIIRATNVATAEALLCDWAESATLALTDANTNYVYVNYNSGTPVVAATVTKSDVDNRDKFLLGKIFRDGTTLHMVEAGMLIAEPEKNILGYLTEMNGEVARTGGLIISEKATQHFELTAGVLYAGLTRLTTSAYDSSATNFNYWYNDGAWQSSATGTISNTQYNNYGTGLATLANNQYGVHWVYSHDDGDIDVVYGIATYTLSDAEEAQPPGNLPDIIADFAFLVGKIIIKKNATTFTDTLSAFDTAFTPTASTIHNELAGIQGGAADDYFHLTSANATVVGNTSNTNTGDQTSIVGITGTVAEFSTAITDANLSGNNTGDQTTIVGITGTTAEFNTACTDADFATGGGTCTGTDSGTNTGDQTSIVGITGTVAEFSTAITDATLSGNNTGDESSATSSAEGIVELAIASEVNTGTDTTRAITADAFAGSNFGIRYYPVSLNSTTALTTDEKYYFRIPAGLTGMNLVSVTGSVGTGAAGSSSSGLPTFTVKNVTDASQMLSTSLTIDATEYTSATATTPVVIDTAEDDVVTDDLIEVAVTTAGTGVTYATVTLGWQLP